MVVVLDFHYSLMVFVKLNALPEPNREMDYVYKLVVKMDIFCLRKSVFLNAKRINIMIKYMVDVFVNKITI